MDSAPPDTVEPRGVADVTLPPFPWERRPTLSRAEIGTLFLEVHDFSHETRVDESLIQRIWEQWVEYAPGVAAEISEGETNSALLADMEKCARQLVVRRFHRPESDPVHPLEIMETFVGFSESINAYDGDIQWHEQVGWYEAWSTQAIARFQEERKEWVWCVAADQRRTYKDTDAREAHAFTPADRARLAQEREERAALLERFSSGTSDGGRS